MGNINAWFERVMTLVLVTCAVVITLSAAYSVFDGGREGSDPGPVFVDSWERALEIGRPVSGPSSAPIKIVTFVDLECPFCRMHSQTLEDLATEHAEEVQVVYVHYPLETHRFALEAARAAECSADFDAFSEWTRVVYNNQDSLHRKKWGQLALEAGIKDTLRIAQCAVSEDAFPRIEEGLKYGETAGVQATPTVLINGWRYSSPPTKEELEADIKTLLSGRKLR